MALPRPIVSLLRHCAVRCDHAGLGGAGVATEKWHRTRHRWGLFGLMAGSMQFGGHLHAASTVHAPASVLIPPWRPIHRTGAVEGGAEFHIAWFQVLTVAGWRSDALRPLSEATIAAIGDPAPWRDAWRRLLACFADHQPRDPTALCLAGHHTGELLVRHVDAAAEAFTTRHAAPRGQHAPPWLREVIEHAVKSRVEHHWRVDRLAQLGGCSPAHLRRLCHRHYGAAPQDLLRQEHVRFALQLLAADPGSDLASIARKAGYPDADLFRRQCRAVTGQSPRELVPR